MKAIVLTRGRIATVDDEDFDRVNQFKWHAYKQGDCYYGVRNIKEPSGKRTSCYLHCFILGRVGVDHRNGDGLDCQRRNLRPASSQQNHRASRRKPPGAYSSNYRGVSWHSKMGKWQSAIGIGRTERRDKHQKFLGYFQSEEDAARAYDAAAKQIFGEFAALNFT